MAKLAGAALRGFQTVLYAIEFCCAAIILGIYSYFLARLAKNDLPIANWKRAVEGLSGSAVLYLILAVLLTFFLGGKAFFAFLAVVLDVLFCGAFIAIAVLTRDGADSCSGNVNTPLGNGPVNSDDPGYGENGFGLGGGSANDYSPGLGLACRLNKACFIVAIIGAVLFLLSAIVQVLIARHHKKEKAFGPSPANNYTSGSGKRRFWQRKSGPTTTKEGYGHDTELGATGVSGTAAGLAPHHDTTVRPSHDTAYTGSTVAAPAGTAYAGNLKFEPQGTAVIPTMDGSHPFHVGPTGTAVNSPYGYDNTHNTRTTANNF